MTAASDHSPDVRTSTEGQAALFRRARAKYLALPLAAALSEYGKQTESHLEEAYRDSVYCTTNVVQEADGTVQSHYCGRRWCLVCNRIRMAKQIDTYLPSLSEWEHSYFVTLTRSTVTEEELPQAIDDNFRVLTQIKDVMRKHPTSPMKLEAVRKLEVTSRTYRSGETKYHPHMHLIVRTEAQAQALLQGWLDRWGDKAKLQGQDIRPVDAGAWVEVFKYATKLVAKDRNGNGVPVPPEQLDVIFRSLYRRRTLQPIGFRLKKPEVDEEAPLDLEGNVKAWKRMGEAVLWAWEQDVADWVDHQTGECLTGHTPPETLDPAGVFLDTLETTSEIPSKQPEKDVSESSINEEYLPWKDPPAQDIAAASDRRPADRPAGARSLPYRTRLRPG